MTADLPGFASAVLEQALGCPALFLQGAAGDITPIRYKDVHGPPPTERLGAMLGLSTLAAALRVEESGSTVVRVVSETIESVESEETAATGGVGSDRGGSARYPCGRLRSDYVSR